MSMLVVVLPFVIGLVVVAMTYRGKGPFVGGRRISEPSCGGCGYCVRGLETFTCPECGGDLRELGIVTPGTIRPMSRRMRLLLWSIGVPIPAYLLGTMVSDLFAPWETVSTQQRLVFSHVPGVIATVRVQQTGNRYDWGRRRQTIAPPPRDMRLTLDSKRSTNVLSVILSDGRYAFFAADGSTVSRPGPFDAQAIAEWLRAHNFTDDAVDEVAGYIKDAIDDMANPSRAPTFHHFTSADMQPRAVAHPTSRSLLMVRPTRFTPYVPYLFAALAWVIGLPFVLRKPRVQSAGHANQA